MARKEEPLQMKIGEAKQRDIGKKRVRLGPDAMDYLKVVPGDVIEISGKRSSCAIVWPADEDEKFSDIIKIDGQTRKNIGGALNETFSLMISNTVFFRGVFAILTVKRLINSLWNRQRNTFLHGSIPMFDFFCN